MAPTELRNTVLGGALPKIESIAAPLGAPLAGNVTYGSVTIEIVPTVVGSVIDLR